MNSVVVAKFGGSVLQDKDAMERIPSWVKEQIVKGQKVVIVVSALKGVTDNLIQMSKQLNPDVPPAMLAETLSMGERTSARLLSISLVRHGIQSVVIDTDSKTWPIITEGDYIDANPLVEETCKRTKEILLPLLNSGSVPIVCGFIGKNKTGETTTLGRGGSDTSAVILGSCLDAQEVLLVKDVEGFFSSDPDKVKNPVLLEDVDALEALALTRGGASLLHEKALRYKPKDMRVRITSMGGLGKKGTIIQGEVPKLAVRKYENIVTMVTITSHDANRPEQLGRILNVLHQVNAKLVSMSSEEKSVILYIEGGDSVVDRLHDSVLRQGFGKALSSYEKLAMLTISGKMLETMPGLINRITAPLSKVGINVFGLVTISSSIRLFVSQEDSERAELLMKSVLEAAEVEED